MTDATDVALEKAMRIPLTQGQEAIVDAEDYAFLSQFKWFAAKLSGNFYATTTVRTHNGQKVNLRMHRALLRALPWEDVDHANRDTLDNRRCNIRIATYSQNSHNCKSRPNKHGFRGISKWKNGYAAQIRVNCKRERIGTFKSAEEAARAYDRRSIEVYGEFACTNFPRETYD